MPCQIYALTDRDTVEFHSVKRLLHARYELANNYSDDHAYQNGRREQAV